MTGANDERFSWDQFVKELTDRTWVSQAECVGMDTELFFPVQGPAKPEAKATCARCAVREECRDYGRHERFGIWGGVSTRTQRFQRMNPKVDRRDALLRAAREMLDEGEPITARGIALRADVNYGLIAYYFGGLQGLLDVAEREMA